MFGHPYSSPSWPADADREHYRAIMRRAHPTASDAAIDGVAAALAMIDVGSKRFVSTARAAVLDGEPLDAATAAEVRLLGRPRKLGCRFDRKAA